MNVASLQQTAEWLLNSQGQAVTLTPPGGTYNVATRTVTPTGTPIATTGVLLPLSRGLTHIPGTDIQSGDMQLLLPGNIAQPLVDTEVEIGGTAYTIVEVAPFKPSGTALYYDCIVRTAK